jgi:hypothetical protein
MTDFLRHTLATLAYRGAKVLRDAPPGFGDYRPGETSRSATEILSHIGDLLDWGLALADGRHVWNDAATETWEAAVDRFHAGLERLDGRLASGEPLGHPAERLFQGPVADALTHVGQLAMMRRLHDVPVKGENYFKAEITEGRVGRDQASPRRQFD